jgi:hypothetical protein
MQVPWRMFGVIVATAAVSLCRRWFKLRMFSAQTMFLAYSHVKTSSGVRSGPLGGQATDPPLPIHQSQILVRGLRYTRMQTCDKRQLTWGSTDMNFWCVSSEVRGLSLDFRLSTFPVPLKWVNHRVTDLSVSANWLQHTQHILSFLPDGRHCTDES